VTSGRDLAVEVLGGVTAFVDGERVDIGPAKCQTVLAALALSARSTVSTSRLVALVWGDDPPRSAERTLQSYIARLRRSLGSEAISRQGASYRLEIGPAAVDVARFEAYLDQGRIDEALAEWSGPPLDGLEAPGLAAAITALEERRMTAVETQLEARAESDPAAAVAELTKLTAQHPFREGLWALLMTALYRSGRQADALAAYRTATEHLVDQLGLDPGPRLRELERMVLSHDHQLNPGPGGQAPTRNCPTGTVTFAFTEIEGLVEMRANEPHGTARLLSDYHRRLQRLASTHTGFVFSVVDDRAGVAFERPADAVAWAAAVHGKTGQGASVAPAVAVRVGLHTGVADEHDTGYLGPAVNLAMQLATIGHGGQTLVSDATAAVLDDPDLVELGIFKLDRIAIEQRLYQAGEQPHPPLRTERRRAGNVPTRLAPLIGRDDLLADIDRALDNHPLVTLVGPGGIGKTSLALAAAARRLGRPANGPTADDETWIVELADIGAGTHLPRAVADTLGVVDRIDLDLTDAIIHWLQDRTVLLILDNCEHLIEAVAEFAERVLRHSPTTGLLTTSRERLGLNDERVVTVGSLDPRRAGADLFLARVAAAGQAPVHPNRGEVAEICRRLDGIPLAIELAAARLRSLSPNDLLDRLDRNEGLALLARRGRPTAGDRHQTLRAAISWSHDLMEPAERTLFQRLSVFTGPFDLAAAEAVAGDQPSPEDTNAEHLDRLEVDRILGDLVDRSMVNIESGPFGRRFRLLQPIRDYGAEQLATSGDARTTASRHTDWCLSRVRYIGRLLAGWDEIEGVMRLEEFWPNLRTAYDRICDAGDHVVGRELIRPVLGEIVLRSHNELGDWVERLLTVTPPDDEDGLIFGLYWSAHRYAVNQDPAGYQRLIDRYGEPDHILMKHGWAFVTGDYQTQAETSLAAGAELRRHGDHHLAERTDINRATALLNLGRPAEQQTLGERLVERYQAQGPPTYLNWSLMLLGYNALFQGQPEQADTWFDRAIDVLVPPRTHTPSQAHEARRVFRGGDQRRAYRILRTHVVTMLETDNMQGGLIAAIEYVNMMAAVDRLPAAARVVGHLETTGLFEASEWRNLIAPAALDAAAIPPSDGDEPPDDDRRQALSRIVEELDALLKTAPADRPPDPVGGSTSTAHQASSC